MVLSGAILNEAMFQGGGTSPLSKWFALYTLLSGCMP